MYYRTILILILIVNCLEFGFCYDKSNDQSDNQLYYKTSMINGDNQNHYYYKKSLGQKYLILRITILNLDFDLLIIIKEIKFCF